ncbi:MAG: hypothetical protein GC168_11575 [Candidatus Hydrogenedens sp.]|nr:hypothetical protein [Candidatus Hydrogenedens sp.]
MARLGDIAHARSGDKGTGANIGIIAYKPEGYAWLERNLTAGHVEAFFGSMEPGAVKRYELPNLGALNFVLPEVLAGGGSRSLRIDAQGKTLGQTALEMTIDIDEETLAAARKD